MPTAHRVLALVTFISVAALADTSPPDGGAERAQRSQQAVDDLRNRLQINGEVAANLTPDERVMLLSGILCDAQEKAAKARNSREQRARISHARRELGSSRPTACKSAEMRAVVRCIRGTAPLNAASPDCALPNFWKYRRALMELDPQWRDLFSPPHDSRP